MSKNSRNKDTRILRRRKQKTERRLKRKQWKEQEQPMLRGSNIHYEMGERNGGINCGGIGVFHQMVGKIGLIEEIDEKVELLKMHVPYHESDHVLNIAYNILVGGTRLEDIEMRRREEAFMDALGAQRIPDPTTAGDFTRRFKREDIVTLMECINVARRRVWKEGRVEIFPEAMLDIDGTIASTYGECKEGMDISYKGIWGYVPLIISLANTKEVLYLVNRPGNMPSHAGAAEWIDRAIGLVKPHAVKVCLRGDTDFSLTENFDRWAKEVDFIWGMDARGCLIKRAEELTAQEWKVLERKPKYEVKTQERRKPENVKERIVIEREYKNIRLKSEQIGEFEYQPGKCNQSYRIVVVRKNLSVERGERVLFDDIRYFFYITTRRDLTAAEVVALANGRCDQENVVEQVKNGVNAMKLPVRDLESNWAYMVMATLAWNIKAWFGILMPNRIRGAQVVKMEFRRFLHTLVLLPCQIIRTGRKIVYRLMGYNDWLKDFFATWKRIKLLRLV